MDSRDRHMIDAIKKKLRYFVMDFGGLSVIRQALLWAIAFEEIALEIRLEVAQSKDSASDKSSSESLPDLAAAHNFCRIPSRS